MLHSMLCVLHMSLCLCVGHGGGCVRTRVCVCVPDVSSWLVYLMLAPQTVIKLSSPGLEG